MSYATLRKVGGSVMVSIPPALLNETSLKIDMPVEISLTDDRCILISPRAPKYTLSQLLEECRGDFGQDDEDREWLDAPSAGGELV